MIALISANICLKSEFIVFLIISFHKNVDNLTENDIVNNLFDL